MRPPLVTVEAEGHRLAPTFAFIDPFGFAGVPMELVSRIARNRRCECLITFMYEAINRFLAHPEPSIQAHFDQLFGTAEWRELTVEPSSDVRRDRIAGLYRRQLVEQARFQYVRTFEMLDQGNRTEYFLYFGTNSSTGLSKIKEALWRADPGGGRVFSDRTVTDQMVLLQPTADLAGLRRMLQQKFRSQGWVRIEQIKEFVLVDTPYSETIHLKQRTLAPMERERPTSIRVRRPPGRREMPGAYPSGTTIRFL